MGMGGRPRRNRRPKASLQDPTTWTWTDGLLDTPNAGAARTSVFLRLLVTAKPTRSFAPCSEQVCTRHFASLRSEADTDCIPQQRPLRGSRHNLPVTSQT